MKRVHARQPIGLRDPWPTTAQQAHRADRAQERRAVWADREAAKMEARWAANRAARNNSNEEHS